MAIAQGDIKFVASEVLDDVPEGGGGPTGHVIADGVSNEIFSDISELDRAGGNVSLRKVFVAVETDNTDTFLDANVIVAEPPTDPNVSVTLFSTKSTFDTRDSARQRVEAYLTEGPEWPGFLLENHVAGQRVIQIFQRPSERAPNIGETLVLIYNEGQPSELKQFVRVIDTSSITRSYTTTSGVVYEAAVISAGLSDALRYDLPGTPPNEYFARTTTKTKLRETSVADAAVYCGVVESTVAVDIGDLATTVESVFTQLVPSAQTEIPLIDVSAGGSASGLVPAGDGTVTYVTGQSFNSTTALSLGNPITPGTLSIAIGSVTLTDTGGQLFDGATAVGVVDYARGTVSFPALGAPYDGSKTITFKAAATPTRVSDTGQVPVTPETRSFNYIVTLLPTPAAGTVRVSYRAQGRWYDLRDTGGGVLRGSDTAYGVGSVNYGTGAVAVTLGALPDVGSAVLFSWGTKANYQDRSDMTVPPAAVTVTLPDAPLLPGSLDVSWNDGTPRTASDNGSGLITGAATGTVDYLTGLVKLTPTLLPLGGQEYEFNYETPVGASNGDQSFAAPTRESDTTLELDLGATNITPGSVRMNYSLGPIPSEPGPNSQEWHFTGPPRAYARDNGNGQIIGELGRVAGTINYTTGIVRFQPDGNVSALRTITYSVFGAGLVLSSSSSGISA